MELNPFSHQFHEDPYPVYRWLRDEAPCYRNENQGWYALSRYDDVLEASQQPIRYSSADGTMIEKLDSPWGLLFYIAEDLEGNRWTFLQARPTMH